MATVMPAHRATSGVTLSPALRGRIERVARRARLLRVVRGRCEAGAAGVLVTHEARHAAWADRVIFLRDGLVVDESGPVDTPESLLTAGGAA